MLEFISNKNTNILVDEIEILYQVGNYIIDIKELMIESIFCLIIGLILASFVSSYYDNKLIGYSFIDLCIASIIFCIILRYTIVILMKLLFLLLDKITIFTFPKEIQEIEIDTLNRHEKYSKKLLKEIKLRKKELLKDE